MSQKHYLVNNCGIVVLAAGGSTRLGRPKQLLPYKGQSLIANAVDTALQTNLNPVVVITGADHEKIDKELKAKPVDVAENKKWREGLASSLRLGLEVMNIINPGIDGVIFMVCDQPYVTSSLLNNLLLKQRESSSPIVASHYGNNLGTPVLFHKNFFPELLKLEGDMGAGKLIKSNKQLVAMISFPKGDIDIDTEDDFEYLLKDV